MVGTLYIVATPIGNLEDISSRAINVLKEVDFIAAEDTRHSKKLLDTYGVDTKLIPYHDHSNKIAKAKILKLLTEGSDIAIVSDAGTPLINDPGYQIVVSAQELGIKVVPLPGACALIAALCASGLPTDQFHFLGFLPPKTHARTTLLENHKKSPATLVFYESKHRILASLKDMLSVFGDEKIVCVARELTKQFETIKTGTLNEVANFIEHEAEQQKGEFVILLAPFKIESTEVSDEDQRVFKLLKESMPVKQAVKLTVEITGTNKNKLYAWAQTL